MNKIVSLLAAALMAAMIMAFAGCSSGSSSAASSASASSGSAAVSSSAASAASSAASSSSAESSAAASSAASAQAEQLAPGKYSATFDTDSSMFHVNEADDGKGTLTVTDDGMTIHVRLAAKGIVNLYRGTAEEAKADAANVIQPTTDTVTYDDGYEEEVYGFDVPVPALGEEFDVAILGEKGTWYDHKVSVSDPVAL